jgi:uncharacterized protein (DUF427 family)
MPPPTPVTESVWDYPRPPRLEPTSSHIRITHAGIVLVDTAHALRILETSHPPVYYIPTADIALQYLAISPRRGSFCEFKGTATYWSVNLPGAQVADAAWSYANPTPAYGPLCDHLAFYASRLQAIGAEVSVDGESVTAQPGDFYGGWITSRITGPFKGPPGTMGW